MGCKSRFDGVECFMYEVRAGPPSWTVFYGYSQPGHPGTKPVFKHNNVIYNIYSRFSTKVNTLPWHTLILIALSFNKY